MRQISFKKPVNPMSAHVEGVTAFFAGMLVCCISATPLFAHGSTNVFNDAVFWFRGGKDCVTVDGYMQQGEFFDDLHANDDNDNNHKMSMSSSGYYIQDSYASLREKYKKNAVLRKEQVVFPALGASVTREMQVLHISDTGVLSGGNPWYFPFSVNPRSVFARQNISNEYTIVSRIRLDDLDSTNFIFKIGYNESNKQGMRIGFFKHPSSSYSSVCKCVGGFCSPSVDGKMTGFQLRDLPVPTNTWVDVAVVVGNGRLRVGIAVPQSLTINLPTIGFAETPMCTDRCELLDSDESYCLFCPGNISTYSRTKTDSFLGSVQQLAIWGRALTDQEVMEAFGMPRPAIFRTGFDNGSSNEFGGTRSGSTQTIDGLGSWQNIANTMKAGDTWTVNFDALRDEANLAQIFSIKSLPSSAAAQIEVSLNGTLLGEGRVAEGSHAFWPVATNIVHEGANELIIKRKDGRARNFSIDAMELGGSLGIGKKSGSSTDDGRTSPDCTATGVPSAADPNTQHWPQELQPYSDSGVTNLHLRVWVDPDVADKASYTFKTRVQGSSRSSTQTMTGDEYFSVYINDEYVIKCTASASATGLNWSRAFQPGDLHGGWNDFEFVCTGRYETCHWLFDYFRFETLLSDPFGFSMPPGMMIFIR